MNKNFDVLKLISKISRQRKSTRNIITYIKQNQIEFNTFINGLLENIEISPLEEGYYNFYLSDKIEQINLIDQDSIEVIDYLNSRPTINLILSRPISESHWLGVIINRSQAERYNLSNPQIVSACNNCTYFDTIISAITDDNFLVYKDHTVPISPQVEVLKEKFEKAKENFDTNITITSKIYTEALDLAIEEIKILIKQKEEENKRIESERIQELKKTVEGRLRLAFEGTKAGLISYIVRRNLIDLRWRSKLNGRYNSIVNLSDLSVVSAGICLSGTDTIYDLTSLVSVVHEGEKRGLIHITRY